MLVNNLFLKTYFNIQTKFDLIKMITLGISIFLVMGSYTLFKELKDSIFIIMVGTKYLPDIKTVSLLIMIPMVLFYGWLSEKIKRHTLLIMCLLFYGIGGIIISYYIVDKNIGLFNLVASKYRLLGWLIYLFLEGCSPFLVSALWSFFNSISQPEDLKNSYITMTIMSKLGGILFAGFAWFYNTKSHYSNSLTYFTAEVYQYSYIMFFASVSILLVPLFILYLVRMISPSKLIGYADVIEKSADTISEKDQFYGIRALFKNWYILGIFGMTFFWEVINVIFNNLRLNVAFLEAESISGITAILYKNIMFMHIFGLFFVCFGTRNIINYFGERAALLMIPLVTGLAILAFLFWQTTHMIFITYLIIRAINYTLAFPVREALFIPTAKSIQYKTKSWIDSFGQKFSKGVGSFYNKLIQFISQSNYFYVQVSFFVILIFLWTIMTYLLGKKWEKTVQNKEIIS